MTPAEYRVLASQVARCCQQRELDVRDAVVAFCDLTPGARVLDVGSGPGMTSAAFTRIGATVVCLDLDHAMLDEVDGPRVVGDALALPVQTGSMDAAFAMGVLHVVDDVGAVLTELLRVVRPGGRVVVVNKGLAPWRVGTGWYGAMTALLGIDAQQWPPIGLLPPTAGEVSVHWLFADAFYALVCRRNDA